MKLSNSELQNLRSRCLAAISYKRELAVADKYQVSLEDEAGSIAPRETQLHTILALVEQVILIRSGKASKVVKSQAPTQSQNQRRSQRRFQPVVAPVEPVVAPEIIMIIDEQPKVESIVPPALVEDVEMVNDDLPRLSPKISRT